MQKKFLCYRIVIMELNSNELRNLRMKEGLRNPDDVFELSDREGLELVHETENKSLIKDVRGVVDDITSSFQETFQLLLEEYKKRKDLPSDEILAYLAENEMDKPPVSFAESDGEVFLEKLGFHNQSVKSNQVPLLFQLPKPLAQFWYKGGNDSWGAMGQEMGPKITEWGHFYRELMEVVWEKIGYYESEKGFVFERVNGIGDHDPKLYYYVWKISRWQK